MPENQTLGIQFRLKDSGHGSLNTDDWEWELSLKEPLKEGKKMQDSGEVVLTYTHKQYGGSYKAGGFQKATYTLPAEALIRFFEENGSKEESSGPISRDSS